MLLRSFSTFTITSFAPEQTLPFPLLQPPFVWIPSSSVFIPHSSTMAGHADSAHRRTSSAVSSVDGAASHNGTEPDSPASASTVPTARSTPFIGPQNHPGIAPQHHPNPLGQSSNNGDIPDGDASQLGDSAFASQLEEVQTQIRMLGSNGPHPPTRNSRYRFVFSPLVCDP